MKQIAINGHVIGQGHPCYIIAEIGVNHNGCLKTALELVDAAKEAGADAVKLQTWNTEAICSTASKQYWPLKLLELSQGSFNVIRAHAKKRKIDFFTTPDDRASVDFVTGNLPTPGSCLVQALKIGSGGLDPELIRYVGMLAKQEKIPVIMSTGMCDWPKVRRSVDVLAETGCKFALMHCVSAYPAKIEDMNLAMIRKLETFGVPVGLSDHSRFGGAGSVAVYAGAKLIEAHITLDPMDTEGPDHHMSMGPSTFSQYVEAIRHADQIMGTGKKQVLECERGTMKILKERK